MPSFYIEQFGCRATQADGATIERQLLDRGCTLAASAHSADVVVLNTCTVTAAADTQARDAIRKLHARNPATRIVVTGCYAQRAPEELAALPGVSWVIGNSHKPQIPALLESHFPSRPPDLRLPSSAGFIPVAALRAHRVLGARPGTCGCSRVGKQLSSTAVEFFFFSPLRSYPHRRHLRSARRSRRGGARR